MLPYRLPRRVRTRAVRPCLKLNRIAGKPRAKRQRPHPPGISRLSYYTLSRAQLYDMTWNLRRAAYWAEDEIAVEGSRCRKELRRFIRQLEERERGVWRRINDD